MIDAGERAEDCILQQARRAAGERTIDCGDGSLKIAGERLREWCGLKRARDFAEVNEEALNIKTVKKALALLEIDEGGLNQTDRDILTIIIEKFGGGPVGLKTVAASLSEEEDTIEEVHEPYLMQLGLLERTPRGRAVTKKGYTHVDAETPRIQQKLV